MGVPKQTA